MAKASGKAIAGRATVVAAAALGAGMTIPAQVAHASTLGQAYYLYYQLDTSIHANCSGANHFIASDGTVALRPYYGYSHSTITSSVGSTVFHTTRENGFSRAFKQEWCRNNDYVFEYYGDDNGKVHRTGHGENICSPLGCNAGTFTWGPWTKYNWAGFGSHGRPGG